MNRNILFFCLLDIHGILLYIDLKHLTLKNLIKNIKLNHIIIVNDNYIIIKYSL